MGSREKQIVLLLDPRGLIVNGGSAVMARHSLYAELLDKESAGQSALRVFSLRRGLAASDDASEIFCAFSNLLMWILGTAKFIHQNRSAISWLIAGNPWESFWLAWIFRSTLCGKAKIQTQFHGDFFAPTWRTLAWRNWLRFKSLTLVASLCDSARFVGKSQELLAIQSCPELVQKSFVSPLPFSLGDFQPKPFSITRHFTVGVVGRLHPDKGTNTALRLIRCLRACDYSFSVVFVGDGPLRTRIEKKMKRTGVSHRLTGHLTGGKLEEIWRDLDVVLSLAPAESFGIVPREALARGKRVIGIQNSGIKDLEMELPEYSGLEVLPRNWDCYSAKLALQRLELHDPLRINRNIFEDQVDEALHLLISSWS